MRKKICFISPNVKGKSGVGIGNGWVVYLHLSTCICVSIISVFISAISIISIICISIISIFPSAPASPSSPSPFLPLPTHMYWETWLLPAIDSHFPSSSTGSTNKALSCGQKAANSQGETLMASAPASAERRQCCFLDRRDISRDSV